MKTNSLLRLALGGLLLLITGASCNLVDAISPQENAPEIADEVVDLEAPSAESEEGNGELLNCFDVAAYVLSVDHTLTINEADAELTHILQHGGIGLVTSTETEQGDCALTTAAPMTIPYEYLGTVGSCDVEASGEVIFSAEGYCLDGIVYLTITEDWQETQGIMVCDDTVVPFPIAGYTAVHSGPDGMGEEFLITSDAAGFTLLREFQGGEGYHSWTLTFDIPLVPLTP